MSKPISLRSFLNRCHCVCAVVTVSVTGCATQVGAGSSGTRPALAPGLYSGSGNGSATLTGVQSGSEEVPFPAPTVLEIGPHGIPVVDGAEVGVGDLFYLEAGGFYRDSVISSVSRSSDGVVIRYDIVFNINLPEGTGSFTGAGNETLKRLDDRTIEYTYNAFLSGFALNESGSITISVRGIYTR